MKKIISYFRVPEWYDSKIPLAMAVGLYAMLFEQPAGQEASNILWYGAYFCFCVIYFAFNYLINDFSDMEEDYKAGKYKVIMTVNRKITLALLIFLPISGCLILYLGSGLRSRALIMGAIVYFLGISYSVKGIRMKERGVWGLVFSSFAQRNTPVLMVASYFNMTYYHFAAWMILCFFNGLRYILIHQYLDRENDKKSGIHTFVNDRNIHIKGGIWFSLVLETGSLVVLFADTWKIAAAAAVIYLAISVLNWLFIEKVLKESYFYSYVNVPLEDLYNVFIPLILSAMYIITWKLYYLIPVTILYLAVPFAKKIYMPYMSFRKIVAHEIGR